MANIYLKLLQDAKSLPDQYRAMGARQQRWASTRDETPVEGWLVYRYV